MPEASVPEILRISMTSCMLQLKCLGQDIETLDFMDKPDPDSSKLIPLLACLHIHADIIIVVFAFKSLYILGALDNKRSLTPIGKQMNNFPIEPALSRALIASKEFGCVYEVLGIVSILSASSKLFHDSIEQRDAATEARLRFRHSSGDHLTALAALRAYEELTAGETSRGARREWCRKHFLNERTLSEALNIQEQLRGLCKKYGYDCSAAGGDKTDLVLKSLLRGLVQHAAILRPEGGYKQIMGHSVSDLYHACWHVFDDSGRS